MTKIAIKFGARAVTCSIIVIVLVRLVAAEKPADLIAKGLAHRVVCESYSGAATQSVTCDWPDLPLESLLALMTPEPATVESAKSPHLRLAVLRLKATMNLPDFWKKELPLRADEDESSSNAGLRAGLEKRATDNISTLSQPQRLERIRSLSKELRVLPEFKDLAGLVNQITQTISQELTLQPELLKRFIDRPPVSPGLVKARTELKARIAN